MKRTIFASLVAAAFAAPAYAAVNSGDETDLALTQYLAPTYHAQFQGSAPATQTAVRVLDENDASWIYAPQAKPLFDGNIANASAKPFVESNDENDLAWLYQAPSAGRYADPRRQEPYVAYGNTANPFGKVRQLFGKSQATGE